MATNSWPIIILVVSIIAMAGDVVAKAHHPWLALLLFWTPTGAVWGWMFDSGVPLGRGVALANLIGYVLSAVIGATWFKEPLSASQGVGLLLGFVGMCLLIKPS